jgi:hypothetical protein
MRTISNTRSTRAIRPDLVPASGRIPARTGGLQLINKIELPICAWLLSLLAMFFIPATVSAVLPVPPPPPPLVIPAPPPVYVIPDTYAYFAPDVETDLFFYGGFWYRPHGGHWYRASHYGGPWGFIVLKNVPGVLIKLPPGYRHVPPGHQRIPHSHLKKNWKKWKQTRHWDRPGKSGKGKSGGKTKDKPPKHHGKKGRGK